MLPNINNIKNVKKLYPINAKDPNVINKAAKM